jgi:hypothetical protein
MSERRGATQARESPIPTGDASRDQDFEQRLKAPKAGNAYHQL